MMKQPRILAMIGLMLALAAAVWWMCQPGGTHVSRRAPQSPDRIFPTQSGAGSDHSMASGPSHTKDRAATSAEPRHPNRLLAGGAATAKPGGQPTGLERVHLALDSSGKVGFADRVHAIRAIQGKLTGAEIRALTAYLRTPARGSGGLDSENWLRNEMLDALAQQADLVPGLAGLMVTIYGDGSQDSVTRDYALQHMAAIYTRVSPEDQSSLQAALWQATGDTDSGFAGTAMLALLSIGGTTAAIDQGRLSQTAVQLAGSDSTGELARITAVSVCGRLGVAQALPVVEQLAQQSTSEPLRIAATAALGDYAVNPGGVGSVDANNLLTQLAESSDPREAFAAESALRRVARAQTALVQQTVP